MDRFPFSGVYPLMSWIDQELHPLDLGDQRLNRRGRLLLERFFAQPQASINAACNGWAETRAAYRFFGNDRVEPAGILRPHQQATRARIAEHPVVLVVQGTTESDDTAHPAGGAGPLSSEQQRGFLDHSHIAFTPEGLGLGVLDVELWARSAGGFGGSEQRRYDPIEAKETYRWPQGYRLACRTAEQVPQTRIVSVADGEGDLYEVFVAAERARPGAKADEVIRAGKERWLPARDPAAGPYAYHKLRSALATAPVVATRQLALPRTPKRDPRTAALAIRAQTVSLKAPYRPGVALPDLQVRAAWVREIHAPAGVEPVDWLLLTSLPIDTAAAVLQVVDYYTGRWPIEVYYRVDKSGCRVEDVQLETRGRLAPCLMLYKIVARRLLYVMKLGRELPQLPCEVVFAAAEWKPVWRVAQRKPLPKRPPRLGAFLKLVGRLGGHNGREGDGAPGAEAPWRGIRRMAGLALAWQTFGPEVHQTTPVPTG